MSEKIWAVYVLQNVANKKQYVGSSTDVGHRKSCHFSYINRGYHENTNIDADVKNFPKEVFVFSILEKVDRTLGKQNLIEREQAWIDLLSPEYNVCVFAGKSIEDYIRTDEAKEKRRQTLLGYKQSPEWINKRMTTMRANGKQKLKRLTDEQKHHLSEINTGENNPNFGLKRTDETRKAISDGTSKTLWTFEYQDGTTYTFKNMSVWCGEDKALYARLRVVTKKFPNWHAGWRLISMEKM